MGWHDFERDALKSSSAEIAYQLRGLVTACEIQRCLRAEIKLYDRWRCDSVRPIQFQLAVPVPDARATDYQLKLLSTPAGRVLAGIRFLGGDVRQPFVQIYARDHLFRPDVDLAAYLRRILAEFSAFDAKRVRIRVPIELEFGHGVCETIDFLTVAGLISEMASGRSSSSGVSVRPAVDVHLYDFYDRAYRQHLAENLQLTNLQPLDRQDFDEAFKKGEMFQVLLNGDAVGLFVIRAAYRDGMRGFLLVDQVVTAQMRGRGIAAAGQRVLAGQLHDRRRKIIFGTIAPENVGSLKTAKSAGRFVVSKCSFLALV